MRQLKILKDCGFYDHEDVLVAVHKSKTMSQSERLRVLVIKSLLKSCGFKSREHVMKAVRNTQPIGGEA